MKCRKYGWLYSKSFYFFVSSVFTFSLSIFISENYSKHIGAYLIMICKFEYASKHINVI